MREADLLLFPKANFFAVALQPVVNQISKNSSQQTSFHSQTYSSLSTLGSITTLSVLKSAVQQ
jgi:hypothetical protein